MMVEQIQKFIEEKRDEGKIINSIIRDDVFSILEKEFAIWLWFVHEDEFANFMMCTVFTSFLHVDVNI